MYPEYAWPVVPICDRQKRDVNSADLLNGGAVSQVLYLQGRWGV